MASKLGKPILVGGVGLSFSLWLLETWHHSIVQVGEIGLVGALALGGGLWLFQKNRPHTTLPQGMILPQDRATVEKAISQVEVVVNQLAQEASSHPALETLREQLVILPAELDRQEIKLAVTGGKSVGKTTLTQVLQPHFPVVKFNETAPLFVETDETADANALAEVNQCDLALFLTNGDITDTEYQTLQQLSAHQRTLLVFNKQDQYLPDERGAVLLALQQRLPGNVVATSASPHPIKVRKHLEDGAVEEWLEQPAADIQQITQQLGDIFATEAQKLVWATTMREALAWKAEAKNCLNGVRREKAVPMIEQYQWIAAAAAFANPVPALDILATAAINAQMVIDLGGIYQQKFSLEQAKAVAGEMGGLMVKLGLVELSTKAIGTVLKANAVTFVAGGVIQGVSAAYLTRVAGLSLVEYFQQQEISAEGGLNLEKFGQILQNVFQQSQQISALQGFVKQGMKRLLPEAQAEVTLA